MKTNHFIESLFPSVARCRPHDNRRISRWGFTLVEMLVSMAILGMIVLLMGRIFADGSSAYKQGLKSSDQNMNGRVIMDFIARELKQAIVDENLIMRIAPSPADPYGIGLNDWISFASVGGNADDDGDGGREVELIRYYVQQTTRNIGGVDVGTYTLNRGITTKSATVNQAYNNSSWSAQKGSGAQMARNISGFAVKLYADENGNGNIELVRDVGDDYETDELPAYADIYMGILGDSDLVEAAITEDRDFVAKREMIFMKRVYFRNRGYNTSYGRELYKDSE